VPVPHDGVTLTVIVSVAPRATAVVSDAVPIPLALPLFVSIIAIVALGSTLAALNVTDDSVLARDSVYDVVACAKAGLKFAVTFSVNPLR
jgi:hypothetical protein